MAKFLVVHPVGSDLTVEAATPLARGAKANSSAEAYWIRSWYALQEGKLYCEWDAVNAGAVQKALEKAGASLPAEARAPVEGIYDAHDDGRRRVVPLIAAQPQAGPAPPPGAPRTASARRLTPLCGRVTAPPPAQDRCLAETGRPAAR